MRKTTLFVSFLSILALGVSFGFTGSAQAQTADAGVSGDTVLIVSGEGGQPAEGHRRPHRAAHALVKAVRENCDCGDVACAEQALDTAIAELLAKLPEGCDEACQTKAAEKLAEIKGKILERVQAAADDPTLCERSSEEPPARPTGEPGGRGGRGGKPGRP